MERCSSRHAHRFEGCVIANRRKIRFYPLKNSDGTTVPNAYVFAFEEYTLSYDQNDIVGIIRNVKAAPSGPELGLDNADTLPFYNRLVFNRIENLDPGAEGYPIARQRIDKAGLQTVMSNSFGFGGTNATLVFSRKGL